MRSNIIKNRRPHDQLVSTIDIRPQGAVENRALSAHTHLSVAIRRKGFIPSPERLGSLNSGRSGQENSISELKDDFAFGYVPTRTYQANSAYLQVSQMAYNLSISLQHNMRLVQKHSSNTKMARFYRGWKWKTFRFLILNREGDEISL